MARCHQWALRQGGRVAPDCARIQWACLRQGKQSESVTPAPNLACLEHNVDSETGFDWSAVQISRRILPSPDRQERGLRQIAIRCEQNDEIVQCAVGKN